MTDVANDAAEGGSIVRLRSVDGSKLVTLRRLAAPVDDDAVHGTLDLQVVVSTPAMLEVIGVSNDDDLAGAFDQLRTAVYAGVREVITSAERTVVRHAPRMEFSIEVGASGPVGFTLEVLPGSAGRKKDLPIVIELDLPRSDVARLRDEAVALRDELRSAARGHDARSTSFDVRRSDEELAIDIWIDEEFLAKLSLVGWEQIYESCFAFGSWSWLRSRAIGHISIGFETTITAAEIDAHMLRITQAMTTAIATAHRLGEPVEPFDDTLLELVETRLVADEQSHFEHIVRLSAAAKARIPAAKGGSALIFLEAFDAIEGFEGAVMEDDDLVIVVDHALTSDQLIPILEGELPA